MSFYTSTRLVLTIVAFVLIVDTASAQIVRERDVIYHRSEGVAMIVT